MNKFNVSTLIMITLSLVIMNCEYNSKREIKYVNIVNLTDVSEDIFVKSLFFNEEQFSNLFRDSIEIRDTFNANYDKKTFVFNRVDGLGGLAPYKSDYLQIVRE